MASTASEAIVDLYPLNGGYSVMGVDADSAVGLLGLLLFINLLRVGVQSFTTSLKEDLYQDTVYYKKLTLPKIIIV